MKTFKTNLFGLLALSGCLAAGQLAAATFMIYSNDFESYATVATSQADTSDADPVGIEWNVVDDTALAPTTAEAGVQVISWLTNAAGASTKCLLLNPSSEAQVFLRNAHSGSRYIIDFQALVARTASSKQSFYFIMRGCGADNNGGGNGDWVAYGTDRTVGSMKLRVFDGTKSPTGWVPAAVSPDSTRWQHHRVVVDPNAPSTTVYVDDMSTPILTIAGVARSEISMPTLVRLLNEATSAADGWWAIDDLTIQVENGFDLSTTWTEGFESYPARASEIDDADPRGPWITVETDGTAGGGGRPLAPGKVQVVNTVAHTGSKSLKLEGGQRAGSTIGWGVPPNTDVQITWWARVPASVKGIQANYLRFSLYGTEGNSTYADDAALLGYGSRDANVGDETSLTYYTSLWVDTTINYTPDTWEEYQLTTHCSQGRYTILKNPSSPSAQVVVDRGPFIGSAATWGPMFMAAWSSSNGTNHPPVYVDDIQIKSLVSNPEPVPTPYTVKIEGSRFTNSTSLVVGGPVGAVAVDPRDNSTIVFAMDAAGPSGALYQAKKVASGNWAVDPTPLVSGLANPSGLTVDSNGTIWWVHDFTMALMRLKAPWASNVPERIVADFGTVTETNTFIDDDPFDVCIAPAGFSSGNYHPGDVVVMDRGVDGDSFNSLIVIDPATTLLDQTNLDSSRYLVAPSATTLGGSDLTALAALPASGEVATLCGADGQITAVNASGVPRQIWPDFYRDPSVLVSLSGLAADPTTGRLWIADDLTDTIWSTDAATGDGSVKEVSFPLVDPGRPDRQMDFHEPAMAFSPDGKFLVVSDTSSANGGGRLIILHTEGFALPTFKITGYNRTVSNFKLTWESAGAATYDVLRGTDLANPASFVPVSTNLAATSFTDTNAVGPVFYRVIARP